MTTIPNHFRPPCNDSGPIQSKWGPSVDLHRWTFKNAYPTGHFRRWLIFGWKWLLDRFVVQKPCEKQWVIAGCFSPSFYSCQAEPSSFLHYYFFFEKKHTYIFLGEDKILTSISFTTFTVSFKKNPPETFHHHRIIPTSPWDEWMIPTSPPPTAGNVGELTLRKRLTLEWLFQRMKLWEKKSEREMVGWLGWSLMGEYQTNGWNGFFLFFFGGGRWFGWLVGWCDSLIHWFKFSCRQKKGEQHGKTCWLWSVLMFVSTSRYVLSEKKFGHPPPQNRGLSSKTNKKSINNNNS